MLLYIYNGNLYILPCSVLVSLISFTNHGMIKHTGFIYSLLLCFYRSPAEEEKKETVILSSANTLSEKDLAGKSEDEIKMMSLMGFSGFDSSKVRHSGS